MSIGSIPRESAMEVSMALRERLDRPLNSQVNSLVNSPAGAKRR